MSTTQQGYAGGHVINLHGDGNVLNVGNDGDDVPYPADEQDLDTTVESSSGSNTGFGRIFGFLVAVAVALYAICHGLSGQSDTTGGPSFPAKSDPYPTGATNTTVLTQVAAAVHSCAQAVVLVPANCPQSVDAVSQASDVHWNLYGDPTDGIRVVFSGGKFDVLGNATFVARYRTQSGPAMNVQSLQYWVQIDWQNGTATVDSITKYRGAKTDTRPKKNPKISQNDARRLVKNAFQQCIAGTTLPMTPGCPQGDGMSGDHAKWKLDGDDPSLNSSLKFDDTTGLTIVHGSYSATVKYSVFFVTDTQTQSGDYDAFIATDGNTPTVIDIRDA